MVSKGQIVGIDWNRILWLHNHVLAHVLAPILGAKMIDQGTTMLITIIICEVACEQAPGWV